jgi:hypothetical protein
MTNDIKERYMDLDAEIERNTKRMSLKMNQLWKVLVAQDVDQADNWNACINTTFKELFKQDEKIAEQLICYMRSIKDEINTVSKKPNQGQVFLRILSHMRSVTQLAVELGIIEPKYPSAFGHIRQYEVNNGGTLERQGI